MHAKDPSGIKMHIHTLNISCETQAPVQNGSPSQLRFVATRLSESPQSELGGMKLYTKLITVVSVLTSLSLRLSLPQTHILS